MENIFKVRTVKVLSKSTFTPEGGKIFYRTAEGTFEEKPLEVSETDLELPYRFLNPIQTLFYKFYRGGNALVSAPTSAGKTGVALIFFKNRKGRLVYTAPTKALVAEKAVELKRIFGKVDIRTGDVIEEFKPVTSRVVVATYENLALAMRNAAPWTLDIGAVVIDEVHSILGSRGQIVEEVITNLLNRGIDLLTLSATVPGAEKLAGWIRASLFLESDWRPVPLERKIIPLKRFKDWTRTEQKPSADEKFALKLMSALYELSQRDEKVIVFVPKKTIGWKMLELANRERLEIANKTAPFEVRKEGFEIAFHNADVPAEERREIEREFREGNLNVLIATQTLAYGVNLPADKVLIGVKGFFDRVERRWVVIPDPLDILQEEGRAGRFGIRERGYSFILPYGAKEELIAKELKEALEGEFEPYMSKELGKNSSSERFFGNLTLFVLVAVSHRGERFRDFLLESFSFSKYARHPSVDDALEWLKLHGFVDNSPKPTEKGRFCLKSGVPPINFEEFQRRKRLPLPTVAKLRPLLYTKRFDAIFYFTRNTERFKGDLQKVREMLLTCGLECLDDNTEQLLFFTEGYTFYYPNISNPPGEFSYLGSDALHLLRTLLELKRIGEVELTNGEILRIAHSLKYGLKEEFAPLGGIRGVGHIRANLLKEHLITEGFSKLRPTDRVEIILEGYTEEALREDLKTLLVELRNLSEPKAVREANLVLNLLKRNRDALLVDDKILYTFGLFKYGRKALALKREDLLKKILEED